MNQVFDNIIYDEIFRLTASQVTQHPTFWDFRKKMLFLRDFVENVILNGFEQNEMVKDPIRYNTQLQMTTIILGVYEKAWYDITGNDKVVCMKGVERHDLKHLIIWLRNVHAHRTSEKLKVSLTCYTSIEPDFYYETYIYLF